MASVRPKRKTTPAKYSMASEESSSGSDYDPDETEVPGGGKSISELPAKSSASSSGAGGGGGGEADVNGSTSVAGPSSRRTPRVMVKPQQQQPHQQQINGGPAHFAAQQQQLRQMMAMTGQAGSAAQLASLQQQQQQQQMMLQQQQQQPRRKVLTKMADGAGLVLPPAGGGGNFGAAAASASFSPHQAPQMMNAAALMNPMMLQAMAAQLAKMGLPPMSVGQMQKLLAQQITQQMSDYNPMGAVMAGQEDEADAAEDDDEDMGVAETYSDYMPSKLKIGRKHPDPVVETASLASVAPGDVWYQLALHRSTDAVQTGALSALQLEAITYTCQQHEHILADGTRAGFLIGDGAGVGKGRTIAGLIYENYLNGRKKAIWVSVSADLKFDSERDLSDIGATKISVHALNKMKYCKINSPNNGDVKKGVIFSTYSSLIGESSTVSGKFGTRLKQLVQWCGEDFDGLVVFDECHRAKNLCPSGSSKPTKTGITVMELQRRLPLARVVYASATGASEPKNMAYMVRLGMWGPGTPFDEFSDFISAIEKRGVGAMEIVAMDMKLSGCYIARQLSFHGTSFKVDEIKLADDFVQMYDSSVKLWVEAREKFQRAAELIDAEKSLKKSMWGQFWSAHQRFFKYLCIGAKVRHVVHTARNAIKMGKCVVIGLQSTGEARTLEQLERDDGELTDFVSTAKGVVQSLIEKHFPAPDRDRINRLLGIKDNNINNSSGASAEFQQILDDIQHDKENGAGGGGSTSRSSNIKPVRQSTRRAVKRYRSSSTDDDSLSDTSDSTHRTKKRATKRANNTTTSATISSNNKKTDHDSDFKMSDSGSSEEDDGADDQSEGNASEDVDSDDDEFDSVSDASDDYAGGRRGAATAGKKRGAGSSKKSRKGGVGKKRPRDKFAYMRDGGASAGGGGDYVPPSRSAIELACQMKDELLASVETLAGRLPTNTLDELIDQLGGTDVVAEMTGRKGRVVQQDNGQIQYESRCEADVPLETLNVTERRRFMDGDKDIAVISEAASSGVSLQSDRRVRNQRRRLHITLELPWSADRAVQQFGRTHRSNQVNAPEYLFLISDLAGERRFASIVAKRLESLGALTHGDRRASESRDLSRFNIDNKYGRAALEATMKTVMGYEQPMVQPPSDYHGNFFNDVKRALVGVGLISQERGVYCLDKDFNNMSKFLNRILGMPVELQNRLFQYFTDTLAAIIRQAKRAGRFDMGILDLGSQEGSVRRVKLVVFLRRREYGAEAAVKAEVDTTHTGNDESNNNNNSTSSNAGGVTARTELHTVSVERGMSWTQAIDKQQQLEEREDEGFYLSHQVRNGKLTAMLAVLADGAGKSNLSGGKSSKRADRLFTVCRPNTGVQIRLETHGEISKKYRRVSAADAESHWRKQYESAATTCSHAYWRGVCRRRAIGGSCDVGLRTRIYHVLSGAVLHVWTRVEAVLAAAAGAAAANSPHNKMQVIRVRCADQLKIVGIVIPNHAVSSLISMLEEASDSHFVDESVKDEQTTSAEQSDTNTNTTDNNSGGNGAIKQECSEKSQLKTESTQD